MKKITISLLAITVVLISGCSLKPEQNNSGPDTSSQTQVTPQASPQIPTSTIYNNSEYGFSLALPNDWQGHKVATSTVDRGVKITIRHPQWTKESPREDIPILIYPLAQWTKWLANNFADYQTAAPIGPQERGRNNLYVFATAPRYNFDFQPGYEQVEEIIKNIRGVDLPEPVIKLDNLLSASLVKSPLTINGQAPGSWFFEATFPVRIFDSNNRELGATTAKAQADWMTDKPVAFTASLSFKRPATKTGYIVFANDNPSGLAENEKKFTLMVSFDQAAASSAIK